MSSLILAIDTATPAVTAGVVRRDGDTIEVLAERVTLDARAHAEQLTPNAVAALADADVGVGDLDAIVVGCGPGPFTGLRVGMATAAAYGHALGLPVHGVCSLDAIGIVAGGSLLVATDARRREVYWARYRDGLRVEGPAVAAPADVPGADEALARPPLYPSAEGLVRAVADWESTPAPLVPLYLRRPDAKTMAERAGSMTVVYGKLKPSDAARCAELESQLFAGDDPWPERAFLAELKASHIHYVAARTDNKVVGYAGIARLGRIRPYEYEIHTIGVDPLYQGQGIGRRLVSELIELASDSVIFLEVRTDNAPAIGLYESFGFVNVGLRRRYYRASGADAYTMKRLPQEDPS